MTLPALLVLTDRSQLPEGRGLLETVRECVDAGARAVVVREHDLSWAPRQRLVASVAATGVTVVTSRTWVPGVHGVHLSAAQAVPQLRPEVLLGRSCHDEEQVTRAVADGVSYLTISPVAASRSKPGYGPALGEAGVRRARELAGHVQVFALGGVGPDNAAALREAGADGVAVMGALMRADRPGALVRRILEQL
jgi:thiamine-phosphate pyrophosphorylase